NNPKAEKVTLDRLQDYKLDDILKIYGKESFDQIAQEYEDAIWGVEDSEEDDIYTDHSSPFFQSDQPFGFDIRIYYGPARESNKKRHMYEEEKIKLPRQTVEIINGMQLTGLSKQFATAKQGMPIQEAYTFMARDINGKPSR